MCHAPARPLPVNQGFTFRAAGGTFRDNPARCARRFFCGYPDGYAERKRQILSSDPVEFSVCLAGDCLLCKHILCGKYSRHLLSGSG